MSAKERRYLEEEEHGDPAHQVPGDDGQGSDGIPRQPRQRRPTARVHQACTLELSTNLREISQGPEKAIRREVSLRALVQENLLLTILHEHRRGQHSEQSSPGVDSDSVHRIVNTEPEQQSGKVRCVVEFSPLQSFTVSGEYLL